MLPALIGAGASILGGLFGNKANKKAAAAANAANERMQREANAANAASVAEANALAERNSLRNREWAQIDYNQQKTDMSTQFVRLREAADAAGLNPLTVLGASMVPGVAGGLSGATFGASNSIAAQNVAPLISTEFLTQGFRDIGMELSGQGALDRAEQSARTRLMTVEAERMGAGGIASKARAGAATVRAKPSVTGAAPKGAPKMDSYGYALDKAGSPMMPDRATDINRTQNEPWFKEMRVGGRDFKVYNDEASESEIASTASLATLPWQWAYQVVSERIETRKRWAAEDRLKAGVSGPVKLTTPSLMIPSGSTGGNNFNPSAFPQLYK